MKFNIKIVAVTLAALALISCGGKADKEAAETPTSGVVGSTNNNNGGGGGGGGGGNNNNNLPPNTYAFSMFGRGTYTSPTVNTDNLLKVTITPDSAGPINDPNSNFTANYGCLQFHVGITQVGAGSTTQVMQVNGGSPACQGAPSTSTIDLSGYLTNGHGPVSIKVDTPRYDFYCALCYYTHGFQYLWYPYGNPYGCGSFCPVKDVYQNHSVRGSVCIQTNGTSQCN